MSKTGDYQALLTAHRELDAVCRNRNGRLFVADWYCEHPFVGNVLGANEMKLSHSELLNYYFQNDSNEIQEEIRKFHLREDGVNYSLNEIFVGAGMSALLTAQMVMLRRLGVTSVYYFRPLYYSYYFLAETLGIKLIPLNRHPLNRRRKYALPEENGAWILICDPIWFMGRPVLEECIEAIAAWQRKYDGKVIVDGAFQYMRWGTTVKSESTSMLDRERTMRAICPTKAVALHGIRFSYCLLPKDWSEDFRYAYANTAGSGCTFDRHCAVAIMRYLNRRDSEEPILTMIRDRYTELSVRGRIQDDIGAIMTYFCFVKTSYPENKLITMDQTFFDTTCYRGRTRFNLLMAQSQWDELAKLGTAGLPAVHR